MNKCTQGSWSLDMIINDGKPLIAIKCDGEKSWIAKTSVENRSLQETIYNFSMLAASKDLYASLLEAIEEAKEPGSMVSEKQRMRWEDSISKARMGL